MKRSNDFLNYLHNFKNNDAMDVQLEDVLEVNTEPEDVFEAEPEPAN